VLLLKQVTFKIHDCTRLVIKNIYSGEVRAVVDRQYPQLACEPSVQPALPIDQQNPM